jgi:hypothetical protein
LGLRFRIAALCRGAVQRDETQQPQASLRTAQSC